MGNKITLQKAFEVVLNKRGLLKKKGLSEAAVLNLRRNYKAGKVSIEKMREVVQIAGYEIAQMELWTFQNAELTK